MLLTRQQLNAITLSASQDDGRKPLTFLAVRPDGSVRAANESVAVTVRATEPETEPVCELPGQPPGGETLLSAETVKAAIKNLPKPRRYGNVKDLAQVHRDNDTLYLGTADGGTTHVVAQTAEDEERFPDLEQVTPKGKPVCRIGFSAEVLNLLTDYALKFDKAPDSFIAMEFRIYHPEKAVVVRWQDDRHEVEALLMPDRLEQEETL